MNAIIEKLKKTDRKTLIIYAVLSGGIFITLLFYGAGDKDDVNMNSVEITEKDKSVYRTKKEALHAKYGDTKTSSYTQYPQPPQEENIESYTDDADALKIIQDARRMQAEAGAAQVKSETPSPRSATVEPSPPVQKLAKAITGDEAPGGIEENKQPVIAADTVPPVRETGKFYRGVRKQAKGNTVSASVYGDQTLMNGSTIRIRLLEDLQTPQGQTIPKGTAIWGVVNITRDRMIVNISSVLLGKDLINVNYIVYDLDGQQGINLPVNVKAELARRAEARSIQDAPTDEITGHGGILEKSAGAVVNTAKNLLSRKAEDIKVNVKANYKIVLK